MVSLLSFFTGKRKSRRAPSPPAATTSTARGSSPTRNRPASRFLSLRHRKSTRRPADIATRRASTETQLVRNRSATKKKGSNRDLPRLALGWEEETATSDSLGLEGVGKPPRLTNEEKEVVLAHRWDLSQMTTAIILFGGALKATGLDTPGILLPKPLRSDREHQYVLQALFALSQDASHVNSLNSLVSRYPQQTSAPAPASDVWTDRLQSALRDTRDPADCVEALKGIIRRACGRDSVEMGLNADTYRSLLWVERDAGYPLDAFDKLFKPRLDTHIFEFLEALFDLWAAFAAHADDHGVVGARIPYLLGITRSDEEGTSSWEELYNRWDETDRRVEHIFYAWIRNQSTKLVLPTKLTHLVEGYPFGEISDAADAAVKSPFSAPERRALHLTLSSDIPVKEGLSAYRLLEGAMRAKDDGNPALLTWRSIQQGSSGLLRELLDEESLAFLPDLTERDLPPNESPDSNLATPSQPKVHTVDHEREEPMYRPFSTITLGPPIPALHARKRSQSYGDLRPSSTYLSATDQTIAADAAGSSIGPVSSHLARQSSTSKLRASATETDIWNSFLSSGFGEAPKKDLELSPSTPTPVSRRPIETRAVNFGIDIAEPPSASHVKVGHNSLVAIREEVVALNEDFLPFVREALSNPAAKPSWPTFSLVRLREPIIDPGGDIEWLLVSVEYKPPVRQAQHISPPIERSTSPAESTSKSFGFFRRSSSFGLKSNGNRRSIFGKLSPQHSASTSALAVLAESSSGSNMVSDNPETISAAPTEYTITEMGEMIKIPIETSTTPTAAFDPARETDSSDWVYRAEGRAHLIFSYTGSSPTYFRRVLRLRKPTFPSESGEEAGVIWKEKLLPQLLPPDLLLLSHHIELDQGWTRALLEAAEMIRPEARKAESGSLVDALKRDLPGSIMDDTTAVGGGGETIFSVEIKPKWGFLPRRENVVPSEAAKIKGNHSRYILHRHLKAHDTADVYDPLDLFSENRTRQEKALEGLWEIWETTDGAKNSLRVYVDGNPISSTQRDLLPIAAHGGNLSEQTAPIILPALNDSGVLSKLKAIQSGLDPIDISSLAARFRSEHPEIGLFDTSIASEPSSQELEAFTAKYLQDPDGGVSDKWTLREHMIAYSLSAIFKDCSLFVTVPLVNSSTTASWIVRPGARVKVIDLDLKSVGSLKKWYDLDEAIWRHWQETKVHRPTTPPQTASEVSDVVEAPAESTGWADVTANSVDSARIPSTRETQTPSSLATQVPTTPARSRGPPTSLSAQRTPDAMSFADALGISPSRPTYDRGALPNTLDSQSGLAVLQLNGLLSAPRKLDNQAEDTSVHVRQGEEATDKNSANIDGTDAQRDVETLATDSHPTSPAVSAIHDNAEDAGDGRKKRSSAPSPSPTPVVADLPEDLDELHTLKAYSARLSPSRDPMVAATSVDAHLKQDGLAGNASPLSPKSDPIFAGIPASSVGEHDTSTLMPESMEMLKDDNQLPGSEDGQSGTSTPFQEFSTPMTDISEPILHRQTEEEAHVQASYQSPALESATTVTEDAAPAAVSEHPSTVSRHVSEKRDAESTGSDVEVSDRTFGPTDSDDNGADLSLGQILLSAPLSSLPKLFAEEAKEEFSHLNDDRPDVGISRSSEDAIGSGSELVRDNEVAAPTSMAGTAIGDEEQDEQAKAASLGRLAFAASSSQHTDTEPSTGRSVSTQLGSQSDQPQRAGPDENQGAAQSANEIDTDSRPGETTSAGPSQSKLPGTSSAQVSHVESSPTFQSSSEANPTSGPSASSESRFDTEDVHRKALSGDDQGTTQRLPTTNLSEPSQYSQSSAAIERPDAMVDLPETPGLSTGDSSIHDGSSLNTPMRDETRLLAVAPTHSDPIAADGHAREENAASATSDGTTEALEVPVADELVEVVPTPVAELSNELDLHPTAPFA